MQTATDPAPETPDQTPDDTRSPRRRAATRAALLIGGVCFAGFWTWALFFASKESINRIEDREWAEQAETICLTATDARLELADFRVLTDGDSDMIIERAGIVDESTDILEQMLDDILAVEPADPKGQAIVPDWEAEYRTYIDDRRNYADQLRETGENVAFYETAVGIPISERIETFAVDNDMASCAPPRDLTR